jgi:predicted metalloprotease with PDZ domain
MRSHLLFVFLLLFPHAGFSKLLRYEISPLFGDGTLRLQVRAWFAGDADGTTELAIPTQFGGAEHLFRSIRSLVCTTPGVRLQINSDSTSATLEHAPGQDLKLYYEVVQDFPGAAATEKTAYRPILQPSYFHFLGNAFFIAPKWNETYDVAFEWRNFPPNWLLHNSFGSQSALQKFSFPTLRWLQSVFVGGDYRLHRAEVAGKPVCLAVRGDNWGFQDDTLFSLLQRMVATQRDFWQDFDMPCYTVALTPFEGFAENPSDFAYLGTALTNSFAAFSTPHPEQDLDDLCRLFQHEMMHHWIGCHIRSGCRNMQFAWFIEGFTEYFALKNMLDGGFATPDQYMKRLNDHIFEKLYASPKREAPNSAIADSFFRCPYLKELPYLRGCVFAFFLDNSIKSASNDRQNLHLFMLDLLEYYQQPGRDLLNNFDFFLERCSEYTETDVEALYQKYIQEGKLIPADEFALPPYLKIEQDEEGRPFFWLDKSVDGWKKGLKE